MGLRAELGASGDDDHDGEGDSEETRRKTSAGGQEEPAKIK